MVKPSTKVVNYAARSRAVEAEFKRKKEEEKGKEEERRREEADQRENEVGRGNEAEVSPVVVLPLTTEVEGEFVETTVAGTGEVGTLAEGPSRETVLTSDEPGSPSDHISLQARQAELSAARSGKRVRTDSEEGTIRKQTHTDSDAPLPASTSSLPLLSSVVGDGSGQGQQVEPNPSLFDFEFSFKGNGGCLPQFPKECAALMSRISGGEERPMPSADDLFAEKAYATWSQHAVQLVGSTNFMVKYYDRCLKRSYERLEKSKTLLVKSSKRVETLLTSAQETLGINSALRSENERLKSDCDAEKAAKESLEDLLKAKKKRLRESRLLEVRNERKEVEERMRMRMEVTLGKLKSHCEETEIVNEKRSLLGQATCVKDFYDDLEGSGVSVPSIKKDMVIADIKTYTDELEAMEVVEITDADFQVTPEVDRMPVEEWVPASPVSEDEVVGSPSPARAKDEVDSSTSELLAPLFGSPVIPPS